MKKIMMFAAIAATTVLVAAGGVFAHGGATGIVKERMELMKVVGQSMKALAEMMRGKAEYNAEQVRRLALTIAEHGGDSMTRNFPEGSLMAPSEALPSIWQDWDRFSKLAKDVSDYAGALAMAAENERHGSEGGMMGEKKPMMGKSGGMMSNGNGMMASKDGMGPSADQLAKMPPDAAFMRLARSCAQCHKSFRQEKQ